MNVEIDLNDSESPDDELDNSFLPHHLRCSSHTFNLIATIDFKKGLNLLTKASSRIHYSS